MKKILVVGQIPKEYGGSYTTGVANVIIEVTANLEKLFNLSIYATNFPMKKGVIKGNIPVFGNSKLSLILDLLVFFIISPLQFLREFKKYKYYYGVSALKSIMYRIRIDQILKQQKPDLVNFHGMLFAPLIEFIDKDLKIAFTFHGFMMDDKNSIESNKKRGIDVTKLYYNGASNVKNAIFLTESMKKIGEEKLGIKNNNTIIPNGVNINKFWYDSNIRNEMRDKIGIKADKSVIISVGALTKRKNHLGFIEYLESIKYNGEYWIIGKTEAQETYSKVLSKTKNNKLFDIKLTEYVEHTELYKYYSAADYYAHPSTSEGQALVVFEALCSGLPILVNKDIKDTVALDDSYKKYIQYLDLKQPLKFTSGNIDREFLSKKCKNELGWDRVAKSYYKYFNKIIDA